ncbi:MAG: peptide chain release factor N(5)-glutamine methyltransferase [Chloroflexi bacterium]|nr:peptide chain release factor N(5)-glutamine methyltransferase [Chloroflexota bacterium]
MISSTLSSLPSPLPRREAELILAQAMGATREWVIAHPEAELNEEQRARFEDMIAQMSRGTPLPYVLGEWEFFGLAFKVNPHVLIPRPETELLIEEAIEKSQLLKSQLPITNYSIADVGTGSGIIAITLAKKLGNVEIFATDISGEASKVAKENAQRHGVADRIKFIRGDLLEGVGKVNMICANLPYIPTHELETLEVIKHEPRLALDGGDDGLRLVERLLDTARDHLLPRGIILAEIAANEGEAALRLAKNYFPTAQSEVKKDLAGLDRLLIIHIA